MSSKDFMDMKKIQRIKQFYPKKNINVVLQKPLNARTINYSKTRSQIQNQNSQPISNFVSRRELNLNSLVDTKGQNQLPVRGKNYVVPVEQNYQQKKTYKYEYKSNYNIQNSRRNERDITSVRKNENQRYRSVEQQSSYRRRDQI